MSNTIVLKFGGSLLAPNNDGSFNISLVEQMVSMIYDLVPDTIEKLVIVVGGGIVARQYIGAASKLGSNNGTMDYFGILVSRLNARLFIESLDDDICASEPATSLQDVRKSLQSKPIVVLGGLQPGQSTTAVAALCAEYVNASSVIFCTDVDGIFTSDPRKDPNAKVLLTVTYDELDKFTNGDNTMPGEYRIIDSVALTILRRSNIKAKVIRGTPENIYGAISGSDIGTTLIKNIDL